MTLLLESLGRGWQKVRDARRGASRQRRAKARRQVANRARFFETMERRGMMSAVPMEIGINLDQVNDYTPNWMFTDIFQHSRPWISHSYNTVTRQMDFNGGAAVPVQTDANGWPTQLATWQNASGQLMQQRLGTLMFREIAGRYPAGTYRAEWQGSGDVQFGFDARELSRGRTSDGRSFALLNVTPSGGGIYLGINSLNAADPIRDVHVWMPDYQGQSFAGQRWQPGASVSPFHPLYRERLQDFGILRFMQTQETNTSDIQTWADRREPSDARQASGQRGPMANGMSVEYMVQLANELNADPWFNMPHMADDSFVRGFATYVRDHLEPGLTAYVEWSNEIWNSAPGYEPYFWIASQLQLPENAGLTHWQFAGREAARDMNIWTDVFAGQSQRIVRAVGGQAVNPWIAERILENMGGSFDAIAIAPYFGPGPTQRASYSATTTVDQVLADMRANIVTGAQMTVGHQRLADDFSTRVGRDIKLLAYEGGPHLNGRGESYQNVLFQATKDPRMADIFRDYLRIQNASGLDAYVHYKLTDRDVATQWGLFGVLLGQDQPLAEAHLYRTLLEADRGTLFTSGPTLVTMNAADPTAHEARLGTASFRVTRGGNLAQPLTVAYSVGGNAVAGSDYVPLAGTVTFPANENTAFITVTPRDDAAVEPNETVTVTLQSGSGYSLVSAATTTASVTIVSDDVAPPVPTPNVLPVLMVIGNNDFYYTEYAGPRAQLEAAGIRVVVGAGRRALSIPHAGTGYTSGNGAVMPDIALVDAQASNYSAIIFVGGYGATQYQFAFPGTYTNAAYNGTTEIRAAANRLINEFTAQGKLVTGICHGVSVLAWARVNGQSPLQGRMVTTAQFNSPPSTIPGVTPYRWHSETNGATVFTAGVLGDVTTRSDDVVVDRTIITGEDWNSARQFGLTIASRLRDGAATTATIVATDGAASEANRDIGVLTVTRTGARGAALVVDYAISGTATNAIDFERLAGRVLIQPGAASAAVVVRPIVDTVSEPAETVTATLVASTSYGLGASTRGTVTIANATAPATTTALVSESVSSREVAARQMALVASDASVSEGLSPSRPTVTARRRVNFHAVGQGSTNVM